MVDNQRPGTNSAEQPEGSIVSTTIVRLTLLLGQSKAPLPSSLVGLRGYFVREDAQRVASGNPVDGSYAGASAPVPDDSHVIPFEVLGQRRLEDFVVARTAWLTAREMEVLHLLSMGMTNKEIARRLDITERTVKNHVSGILGKLNFKNRVQVALFVNGIDQSR